MILWIMLVFSFSPRLCTVSKVAAFVEFKNRGSLLHGLERRLRGQPAAKLRPILNYRHTDVE